MKARSSSGRRVIGVPRRLVHPLEEDEQELLCVLLERFVSGPGA
ncbi:hypothetical protein ACIHEJ_33760 [Streptomyces sp. NPDC052301]